MATAWVGITLNNNPGTNGVHRAGRPGGVGPLITRSTTSRASILWNNNPGGNGICCAASPGGVGPLITRQDATRLL